VEGNCKKDQLLSVISSAATVYLTTLFAWDFLAKILSRDELANKLSRSSRYIVLGTAALVAGFLLMFSDTFWFNAVEAEVYGLAMFILILISYLGLVWVDHQNDGKGDRILIFICYIAFLGVGAHLYTMLTIPAVFVLLLISEPKKILQRLPIWITGTVLCSVIYYVGDFIFLSCWFCRSRCAESYKNHSTPRS
jgi:4-amino-4-deoxy-L-arabinose transferase-like glycosyltransferase